MLGGIVAFVVLIGAYLLVIRPWYQSLKVGSRIPMTANSHAEVQEMDPHHSMLLVFRVEGQWENATCELVMTRKCLLDIKRRAEKLARGSAQ